MEGRGFGVAGFAAEKVMIATTSDDNDMTIRVQMYTI